MQKGKEKKKMKKKVVGILVAGMCLGALTLHVAAVPSILDVKPGDVYSYWTLKDGGADWDNYFYVTPQVYTGSTIYGRSYAQDDSVSSGYYALSRSRDRYSYGNEAKAGKLYRLETYASPATAYWHLTGRYTP